MARAIGVGEVVGGLVTLLAVHQRGWSVRVDGVAPALEEGRDGFAIPANAL